MKHTTTTPAMRLALLMGTALLATPAFAQDVTPPPVMTTTTTPSPPVTTTAPARSPQTVTTFAPQTAVVQPTPVEAEEPAPQPAARQAPARQAPARQTARTTQPQRSTSTAQPAAEAPATPNPPADTTVTEEAPVQTTAPVETAQLPEPAPVQESAPASEPAPANDGAPIWPWLLLGALIAAGAAFFLLRRKRVDEEEVYYNEPVYEEPVVEPVAAEPALPLVSEAAPRREQIVPVAEQEPEVAEAFVPAGPIAAEAHASKADAEDLEGVTSGSAPVAQRPWLELGMRPVRAGTSADEALVEIELIIGNSGDTPAQDVRISTFMLSGDASSEMEEMLIDRGDAPSVPPVTINPGEGTRVDARLALRKAGLDPNFSPVVVADARYRLADGTEGRTSASFRVGIDGNGELEPIEIGRPAMHDNVMATLHGKPAHA